jgi:hypothetical protein
LVTNTLLLLRLPYLTVGTVAARPGNRTAGSDRLGDPGLAATVSGMSRSTSLWSRVVAGAAVAAAAVVAPLSPAHAYTPAVTYSSPGAGYNNVYNGQAAGSHLFSIEGGTVIAAFCVEQAKALNPSASFSVASLDSAGITNAGGAAWLAINHASVGTPLGDTASENSAVQVAIWVLTDGITVDATTVPSPAIRDRAVELAAAVGSNTIAPTTNSFALAIAGELDGGEAVFTVALTGNSGSPLGSEPVTVMVDGESYQVTTNSSGTAQVRVPAAPAGGSVSAEALWMGTLPAGQLIVPDDGSQILVTAAPAAVARTATTQVGTTGATPPPPTTVPEPAPTTVPDTVPEPAPTTVPDTSPETEPPTTVATAGHAITELPFTGNATTLMTVLGAVALLLVAFLVGNAVLSRTDDDA